MIMTKASIINAFQLFYLISVLVSGHTNLKTWIEGLLCAGEVKGWRDYRRGVVFTILYELGDFNA